jgi:hypothetical protein
VAASVSLAGGGSGATTGSCGAFSGGLMALSAAHSPRSETLSEPEREDSNRARAKFNEFRDWFIREYGGVSCRDVQTRLFGRYFNLMDEEGHKEFFEFIKSGPSCNRVMTGTAVKVAQMLSQEDCHR